MARPSRFLTRRRVILGALAVAFVVLFTQWRAAIHRNRTIPTEPFRIAANLYAVGHTGLGSHLVTGPEGHILIDGGFPEHGPLVARSIEQLGFRLRDVKILLNSHAHADHAGGLAYLQEVTGAELWVSEGDAELMATGGKRDRALGLARFLWYVGALRFDPPRVDRTFTDGEVVRLGRIALTAHVTPGHTRGCTSWGIPLAVAGDTLLAVNVCSLTLFPFVPVDPEAYPGANADWQRSFRTLRALPADVFLASHTEWVGLARKRRQQRVDGDVTPFVGPGGYRAFIDAAEATYRRRREGG